MEEEWGAGEGEGGEQVQAEGSISQQLREVGLLQEFESLTDHTTVASEFRAVSKHSPHSPGERVYWRRRKETRPPKEGAVPSRGHISDKGTVLGRAVPTVSLTLSNTLLIL